MSTTTSGQLLSQMDARVASILEETAAEEPPVEEKETLAETPAAKEVVAEEADPKAKRIERLAELERKQQDKRRAKSAKEQELAAREQQLQVYEQHLKSKDSVWEDPVGVLDMLEQKVGPEKLVEWLNSAKDPAKLAAREAKKDLGPIMQELENIKAHLQKSQFKEQEAAVHEQFAGIVAEFADGDAKLTAKALKKNKAAVIKRGNAISDSLAHRKIKHNLYDIVKLLEEEFQEAQDLLKEEEQEVTEEEETKSTTTTAKGKAKSITNREASTRTGIVPTGGKLLPFHERVAQAARVMRKMPQ